MQYYQPDILFCDLQDYQVNWGLNAADQSRVDVLVRASDVHGQLTDVVTGNITIASRAPGMTGACLACEYKELIIKNNILLSFTISWLNKHPNRLILGDKLEYSHADNTITISWKRLFSDSHTLRYEVYIGAQIASSDYVIGLQTTETSVTFTSSKLTSPSNVHCVITAVSAAGVHATHRETVYI